MSSLGGFVKRIRDIMRNDAGINGDAQRIEQIAWLLFLNCGQKVGRKECEKCTITNNE